METYDDYKPIDDAEGRWAGYALLLLTAFGDELLARLGRDPMMFRTTYLSHINQEVDSAISNMRHNIERALDELQITAYQGAAVVAANRLSDEIADKAKYGFLIDPERALLNKALRREVINSFLADAKKYISATITKILAKGGTLSDFQQELQSAILPFLKPRIATIMRTELRKTFGELLQQAFLQAKSQGIARRKQWLAMVWHPVPPRPAHFSAHGQIVPIDSPFIVGGEALMFPGDPRGSPSNICNCRCIMVPI